MSHGAEYTEARRVSRTLLASRNPLVDDNGHMSGYPTYRDLG
jgi:hypothetical protein